MTGLLMTGLKWGVFLDISKAFGKVWHKGIFFKLKQNGIGGKLLSVLSDFLINRKQRVTLNEQVSSWTGVNVESVGDQFWVLCFFHFILTI